MAVTLKTGSFRFEVAFSFAGPHRDKVRAIAEIVRGKLGDGKVFFDEWFEDELGGDDAEAELQRIYGTQCLMVVADVSEEYSGRPWCQAEARAVRALRMTLDTAGDPVQRKRLAYIRFDDGEVPGVLPNAIAWDGQGKDAQQLAELLLSRLRKLKEELGIIASTNAVSQISVQRHGNELPQGDSTTGVAARGQETRLVWHSTLASRAAGQVSVLACAETLGAVALYWWIAIRYNTHWHLISSVFIAPLLLLRSPESIAAGVRWFEADWLGLESFKTWPTWKMVFWIIALALFSVVPTLYCDSQLINWLTGREGWPLFARAVAIGALSMTIAVSIANGILITIVSEKGKANLVAISIGLAITGASFMAASFVAASAGIAAGKSAAVGVGVGAAAGLIPAIGTAYACRAIFIRVVATLRHLPAGVKRIPENWRENNFLTDTFLPAELMPGIRGSQPHLSSDGLARWLFASEGEIKWIQWVKWLYLPVMGLCFFVPVLFYRLNIKATAWFWWPLAYLLKPAPVADREGQQKQALCWPWTNPFQTLWILVSVLLMLVSLTLHNFNLTSLAGLKYVPALPLALKVSLAIGWNHLAPWHWAQWIIAGAGAGMLALAGNARSHDVNNNWQDYIQRRPRNIRLMTGLQRVRTLAIIALLLMVFGGLLLQGR